ncbi:MAG TPA: methyltransferase domain-containing protein [Flavobacteriaceae bacterium]|nr:methyltransferase domain-containing protein [Flavobacteriaceae bacterium]
MKDVMGMALLDYFNGKYSEDILTETNISEEDVMPVPYLFRTYAEMPAVEQTALNMASGRVLDVGCGAGIHALYLQEKGLEVTAIDTSPGAVEVSKLRGVKDVRLIDLLDLKEEKFDTILILMNGTGIFQTVEKVPAYLEHLKTLLNPKGKIYIDSTDLRYMYDTNDDGSIWVPGDRYYGELEFVMRYKGMESDVFDWLYLGEHLFDLLAEESGFNFEVVERGENFDYLAVLRC